MAEKRQERSDLRDTWQQKEAGGSQLISTPSALCGVNFSSRLSHYSVAACGGWSGGLRHEAKQRVNTGQPTTGTPNSCDNSRKSGESGKPAGVGSKKPLPEGSRQLDLRKLGRISAVCPTVN
ncbi:hypothetical protein L596_011972 [Steinernema carpocapsae]|uniref:Uncharacterized protein n=1 Tax=Steinernema carpocapsae TaxID=34508 RepID=A0A4U5NVL6_STECR|nr:hypothetical protein L596_011972 [Steinernema carpocapsae]